MELSILHSRPGGRGRHAYARLVLATVVGRVELSAGFLWLCFLDDLLLKCTQGKMGHSQDVTVRAPALFVRKTQLYIRASHDLPTFINNSHLCSALLERQL